MSEVELNRWSFGFAKPQTHALSIPSTFLNIGETQLSEFISYRHWSGPAMMARRTQGGRGTLWDIIYDGSLIPDRPNIEYQTLDGSGWYATWLDNGFYLVRGDGTGGHPADIIQYLSCEPNMYGMEATWSVKQNRFNVKRLS